MNATCHKLPWVALMLGLAAAASLAGAGARAPRATAQGIWGWWSLPAGDARFGHAAILDVRLDRMLVMGGLSASGGTPGARQLDLATGAWAPYAPGGDAPVRRPGSAPVHTSGLVLDAADGVALTECDCVGGSTWLLDLTAGMWSPAPGDTDLAIVGGALAYDPVGDTAILYGGRRRAIGDPLAGVWAYDLSPARGGWRSLPDAPVARLRAAAVVDPASHHLLAFGGQDELLEPVDTLWRMDLADVDATGAWDDITTAAGPGPSARVGASFVWVPEQQAALLYGGYGRGGDSDEVWWLEYADPDAPRWLRADVGNSGAGARSAHAGVWDEARGQLIVQGGTRGDGSAVVVQSDAWALRPGLPPPSPTPTASPSPSATTPPETGIYLPFARRGL